MSSAKAEAELDRCSLPTACSKVFDSVNAEIRVHDMSKGMTLITNAGESSSLTGQLNPASSQVFAAIGNAQTYPERSFTRTRQLLQASRKPTESYIPVSVLCL